MLQGALPAAYGCGAQGGRGSARGTV